MESTESRPLNLQSAQGSADIGRIVSRSLTRRRTSMAGFDEAELLPASGSDAVTQNFLKAAASRRNWQPGRVELVSKLLGLDSELQPSGSGRGHADDTADISEVASLRSKSINSINSILSSTAHPSVGTGLQSGSRGRLLNGARSLHERRSLAVEGPLHHSHAAHGADDILRGAASLEQGRVSDGVPQAGGRIEGPPSPPKSARSTFRSTTSRVHFSAMASRSAAGVEQAHLDVVAQARESADSAADSTAGAAHQDWSSPGAALQAQPPRSARPSISGLSASTRTKRVHIQLDDWAGSEGVPESEWGGLSSHAPSVRSQATSTAGGPALSRQGTGSLLEPRSHQASVTSGSEKTPAASRALSRQSSDNRNEQRAAAAAGQHVGVGSSADGATFSPTRASAANNNNYVPDGLLRSPSRATTRRGMALAFAQQLSSTGSGGPLGGPGMAGSQSMRHSALHFMLEAEARGSGSIAGSGGSQVFPAGGGPQAPWLSGSGRLRLPGKGLEHAPGSMTITPGRPLSQSMSGKLMVAAAGGEAMTQSASSGASAALPGLPRGSGGGHVEAGDTLPHTSGEAPSLGMSRLSVQTPLMSVSMSGTAGSAAPASPLLHSHASYQMPDRPSGLRPVRVVAGGWVAAHTHQGSSFLSPSGTIRAASGPGISGSSFGGAASGSVHAGSVTSRLMAPRLSGASSHSGTMPVVGPLSLTSEYEDKQAARALLEKVRAELGSPSHHPHSPHTAPGVPGPTSPMSATAAHPPLLHHHAHGGEPVGASQQLPRPLQRQPSLPHAGASGSSHVLVGAATAMRLTAAVSPGLLASHPSAPVPTITTTSPTAAAAAAHGEGAQRTSNQGLGGTLVSRASQTYAATSGLILRGQSEASSLLDSMFHQQHHHHHLLGRQSHTSHSRELGVAHSGVRVSGDGLSSHGSVPGGNGQEPGARTTPAGGRAGLMVPAAAPRAQHSGTLQPRSSNPTAYSPFARPLGHPLVAAAASGPPSQQHQVPPPPRSSGLPAQGPSLQGAPVVASSQGSDSSPWSDFARAGSNLSSDILDSVIVQHEWSQHDPPAKGYSSTKMAPHMGPNSNRPLQDVMSIKGRPIEATHPFNLTAAMSDDSISGAGASSAVAQPRAGDSKPQKAAGNSGKGIAGLFPGGRPGAGAGPATGSKQKEAAPQVVADGAGGATAAAAAEAPAGDSGLLGAGGSSSHSASGGGSRVSRLQQRIKSMVRALAGSSASGGKGNDSVSRGRTPTSSHASSSRHSSADGARERSSARRQHNSMGAGRRSSMITLTTSNNVGAGAATSSAMAGVGATSAGQHAVENPPSASGVAGLAVAPESPDVRAILASVMSVDMTLQSSVQGGASEADDSHCPDGPQDLDLDSRGLRSGGPSTGNTTTCAGSTSSRAGSTGGGRRRSSHARSLLAASIDALIRTVSRSSHGSRAASTHGLPDPAANEQ